MFPFSSITSIVPFFLLAIAYFLYFSAAILTKHIPHDNIAEQKENVIQANVNSLISASYPDFRNIIDNQSPGLTSAFHSFSEKDISWKFLRPESNPGISDLHRVSAFFPRPPPCS